jgi:hypothetical protein
VGLPKRRGTIASAGQTPSTRRWAAARRELVPVGERGRLPERGLSWWEVQARVPGWGMAAMALRELLAAVAGWGRSACASVCAGTCVPVTVASEASPGFPDPRAALQQLQSAAAQRRQAAEEEPVASGSLVPPATQAAPRRPQGALGQLETTGSGYASPAKPSSLGCLPQNWRVRRGGHPFPSTSL